MSNKFPARLHYSPARVRTSKICPTWVSVSDSGPLVIDDEIGALALVRVGQLASEDRVELVRGHSGPREDALALDLRRRGDGDDLVECAFAAGLEQQRDVEQ